MEFQIGQVFIKVDLSDVSKAIKVKVRMPLSDKKMLAIDTFYQINAPDHLSIDMTSYERGDTSHAP